MALDEEKIQKVIDAGDKFIEKFFAYKTVYKKAIENVGEVLDKAIVNRQANPKLKLPEQWDYFSNDLDIYIDASLKNRSMKMSA